MLSTTHALLTDPEKREEAKRKVEREKRKSDKIRDTGL